ncbi:MAG: hypothetical protein ACYCOU_01905 [Sulfobacillus sp.]
MNKNFCPKCGSLLRFSSTEDDELVLKCNQCSYEEIYGESQCVYVNGFAEESRERLVNPDFCYDQTLVHTSHLSCPNQDCPTHKPENPPRPDVVKFAYNKEETEGYLCRWCLTYWKA